MPVHKSNGTYSMPNGKTCYMSSEKNKINIKMSDGKGGWVLLSGVEDVNQFALFIRRTTFHGVCAFGEDEMRKALEEASDT